jgi:hypothetical protein
MNDRQTGLNGPNGEGTTELPYRRKSYAAGSTSLHSNLDAAATAEPRKKNVHRPHLVKLCPLVSCAHRALDLRPAPTTHAGDPWPCLKCIGLQHLLQDSPIEKSRPISRRLPAPCSCPMPVLAGCGRRRLGPTISIEVPSFEKRIISLCLAD